VTSNSTATTAGAKAHAREQEGTLVAASPSRPATSGLTWQETVAGANYSHMVVARGTEVTLTDIEGDACAHVLAYNAAEPHERLNVADTVKVQWQVYISGGYLLLSDQGRVLATVVADDAESHDSIYGTSTLNRNIARYGAGTAHSPSPAGRELLALAGLKHGLTREDIAPSISFFKGVRITDQGTPEFLGSKLPGRSVTIRAEMDLILLIANTAHPLDPRTEFNSSALKVEAKRAQATSAEDAFWNNTPEGRRAFVNTHEYLAARGIV